jgi:hypothetical protein
MLFWNYIAWVRHYRKLKFLKGLKSTALESINFWEEQVNNAESYELYTHFSHYLHFWEAQLQSINMIIIEQQTIVDNISILIP